MTAEGTPTGTGDGGGEAAEQAASVSEAQIAVHWREEEYFQPPAAFVAQANATDPAILERFSEEHFPECFTEYAEMLTWDASGTRSSTRAIRRSGSGWSAGA